MENVVNFNGGDGNARQRGEQHAAQAVAQRCAEAALQRLHDEFAVGAVRLQIRPFRFWAFLSQSFATLLYTFDVIRKIHLRFEALFGVQLNDEMLFVDPGRCPHGRHCSDLRLTGGRRVQPLGNRRERWLQPRLELLAGAAGLP